MRDGRFQDRVVIETWLPFRGAAPVIEVVFPYEYPDEAPIVYGPLGLLDRHQHPRGGNFCIPENHDRDWSPGMAAAQLVADDLRWLLEDMESGSEAVRRGEADMPEPVTGLLALADAVVVVPDPFFERELPASEGRMTLLGGDRRYVLAAAANLGSADQSLVDRYARHEQPLDGYWVALASTPAAGTFEHSLVELVDEASHRVFERLRRRLKERQSDFIAECWLGITFEEEGPARGEHRRNWVFTRVQLQRDGARRAYPLIGAQALTLTERQRRIPELAGLADARVLLVGTGSVGSPVALELAKAGVGHLDVIDPDRFDVNNSVRHVLGPAAAGLNKASATAAMAETLNPFVTVEHHEFTVGAGRTERVQLSNLISSAAVVVDTTGSQSVARILQKECIRASKPLIVAGLTAGGYGGEIVVSRSGTPCITCFVLAQTEDDLPSPATAPPSAQVTPVGCSHPAFAGAGFEATELAALTARTTVQVSGLSNYPDLDWDWAVLNFRSGPRWTSGTLGRHSGCPVCGE